jgi:hypothetical protein
MFLSQLAATVLMHLDWEYEQTSETVRAAISVFSRIVSKFPEHPPWLYSNLYSPVSAIRATSTPGYSKVAIAYIVIKMLIKDQKEIRAFDIFTNQSFRTLVPGPSLLARYDFAWYDLKHYWFCCKNKN